MSTIPSSWNEFVPALTSSDVRQRTDAYAALRPRMVNRDIELPSESQITFLNIALLESDDDPERKVLGDVLHWINSRRLAALHGQPAIGIDSPPKLAEWFWKPLHRRSIAFRAWEENRRRDEDALFDLARFLSYERYPDVEFTRVALERVELEQFSWGNILTKDLSAVVFLGRLGMYGKTALKHFHGRSNWFRFLSDERPLSLPFDQFDSKYHRICGRDEKKNSAPKYLTYESNGKRTDYGLVQRYVVTYNTGRAVVIGLWGCSTLGTLAAVRWAIGLQQSDVPLPETQLTDSTPLEALIKVQAHACSYPGSWEPEPIQLQQLHIGKGRWDIENGRWNVVPTEAVVWERLEEKKGRFIIGSEQQSASGLIARIMNSLVSTKTGSKKYSAGTIIEIKKIASAEDFSSWESGSAYRTRIRDYTRCGVEPAGVDRLRVVTSLEVRNTS